MGLCMSKSSARSTPGSEKSERCRLDKHGNVFFPVRRSAAALNASDDDTQPRQPRAFMNPVYTHGLDSPNHARRGFSSISRLLKGSKAAPPLQLKLHPLSPSRIKSESLIGATSLGDLPIGEQHPKRHGTLLKFIEAEKIAGLSLSRSSSAKEGSLTRSSSTKEAALSRCSSQKEGKRDCPVESLRPSPDHLAAIAGLKSATFKLKSNEVKAVDEERQRTSPEQVEATKAASIESNSNLVTRSLELPSGYHQPLIFQAVSPDRCRGRCSSTHSSLSSEELAAVTNRQRRRSPGRKSPGRRSPRKCSPVKRTGVGNFVLNASAARFQKSLPGNNPEIKIKIAKPPQAPKDVTSKESQGRSALRELPLNSQRSCRRQSSPVKTVDFIPKPVAKPAPATKNSISTKSEKFSVFSDSIHLDIESRSSITSFKDAAAEENPSCLMKEPRSGSKRLRSPKRIPAAALNASKENINLRLSAALDDKLVGSSSEDKHVDVASTLNKQVLDDQDSGPNRDRDLLDLLERTPKKLKKMALKLALMIELEENSADDEDDQGFDGIKQQNVDLELKLGMPPPDRNNKRPNRDGVRLDLSFALDSPTKNKGSISVPATPRPSISSTCSGLSVEARINSSKHSDFSFHILKNPDELFGKVSRVQISRTTEQQQQKQQQRDDSANSTSSKTNSSSVDASASKVAVDLTSSREEHSDPSSDETTRSKSDTVPVQRCSSFGFENDDQSTIIEEDNEVTPSKRCDRCRPDLDLDLNRDAWDGHSSSPGFEFQTKSAAGKSLPATPVMPAAPKLSATNTATDALSLSADEIAEIWGAFEAGQEEICS